MFSCEYCETFKNTYFEGLVLTPGPGPWTGTLDSDPEKPRHKTTWTLNNLTQKDLDPEKPGPRKTRIIRNMDPKKQNIYVIKANFI